MVKVSRQRAVQQKSNPTGGVLDRIRPVSSDEDGLRIVIYGRSKTGKTRLASTFPKPLLLIGTEKGTRSVVGTKGLDFVRLRTSEELDELTKMLAQENSYRTVALDTAGGLQDLILKEVAGLDEIPVQKSWGLATQQQWGQIASQTKERLRGLLALSESLGMNVVIIAHERNFTSEDVPTDILMPSIGAALTPQTTGWLNGACDYLCQTYIREQTTADSIKAGGKAVATTRRTGRMEYCLRVGPHPVYMTGFRVPPGKELPDSIVDPTYDRITDLIK